LIVANKCDVQGGLSVEEVKRGFGLSEWLPHHKFLRVQTVSATSGYKHILFISFIFSLSLSFSFRSVMFSLLNQTFSEGVKEILEWLVKSLREAAIAKAQEQENDLLNNTNTKT
jgi:hypothetical protein